VGWGALHRERGTTAQGLTHLGWLTGLVWLTVPAYGVVYAVQARHLAVLHLTLVEAIEALPERPARLLINDAGMITWYTDLPSLDIVGLGNDTRLPVGRYWRAGAGALWEWLEDLPEEELPSHVAVFEDWTDPLPIVGRRLARPALTPFGPLGPVDGWLRVAGAVDMTLAEADWSGRAGPDRPPARRRKVVDEVDLGDLVEEEAHRLSIRLPGPLDEPRLRLVRGITPREEERWEGGWLLPPGGRLGVDVDGELLIVRLLSADGCTLVAEADGVEVHRVEIPGDRERFREIRVPWPGGRLELRVEGGFSTVAHVWGYRGPG
jgi:hypothetical protein